MMKGVSKTIDYIFWILLIVYSNPGGFLQAIGIIKGYESSIFRDAIFFLMLGCFITIMHVKINKSKEYKRIIQFLIIFGIYYFLVFGYFTPNLKSASPSSYMFFFKKSRYTLYSIILFVIIYHFYIRSRLIFFRLFIISSIIVLILFILTIVTGVSFLPIDKMARGFVKVDRIFLYSYGFMPLLIPIGAVTIIFFKKQFKWKNIILLASGLMFLSWLLSITRRHIIGTFIYLFIAMVLYNYVMDKSIIPIKKLLLVGFYMLIFGFVMSLSFPKYINAGITAVDEVVQVASEGKTSKGSKDARLGFGKEFMQNLIKKNPFFGTGFDNRWRTKEGDDQGYEAADYPFLGALAMTGIIGVLIFLPIYIIIIKSIVFDIKFIKKSKINFYNTDFYFLIIFLLYFIYDLLLYMNWFTPVSLSSRSTWYIYLAMFIASRDLFYRNFKQNYAL